MCIRDRVEGKDGKDPFNFQGQVIAFAEDIELSADWTPIGNVKPDGVEDDRGISLNPFSGTIDGKGHKMCIRDSHRREQSKKLSEFLLKMFETRRLLTKAYNKPVNSG